MMRFLLIETPRWLLLALLVYAPWAYGSIPEPWREYLVYGSHITVGLWLIGSAIRRRYNYLNFYAFGWIVLILVQGIWMTYNARFEYDSEYDQFIPLSNPFTNLPGSISLESSKVALIQSSAFLGILLMVCEISQNPVWRNRIMNTICWVGFSVVFLGISQHLLDFLLLYPKGINVWPFATYYYHGNAGAYMNLVLPFVIGRLLICFRNQENQLERSVWICVAALCAAGPFINASKGATPIAILILLIMSIWQIKRLLFHLSHAQSVLTLLSLGLILLVALSFLIYFIGPEMAIERWTNALSSSGQFARGRLLTSEVCLKMSQKSGLWGFGADTFHVAFPFFTNEYGTKLYGYWRYAHMDYLQTLVEWGWLGCITWGMLLVGGIFRPLWSYFKYYDLHSTKDRLLTLSIFLALGGISIHMLYDFPMQIASIQFYTVVILGLAYGSGKWAQHE